MSGTDERRPVRLGRRHARHARTGGGPRPVLIAVLVALASVPTSALILAGAGALQGPPDGRRPFVADRATGPVVVGPDGTGDGALQPPLYPQPVLSTPSPAGFVSPQPPPARARVPESTAAPRTESCTGPGVLPRPQVSPSDPPPESPSAYPSPPSPSDAPAPSGSPESTTAPAAGGLDLDLGIIHIHVGG